VLDLATVTFYRRETLTASGGTLSTPPRTLSRGLLAWGVVLTLVAASLGLVGPATAASKPPPVSGVHLVKRADHALTIAFAVPAAYYHRGAGVVVRLTRGKTAAARASAGYAVAVSTDHQATIGLGLTADALYTFAIWIHDGGKYSKRVVFRARTAKDTTPPDPVEGVRAIAGLGGTGDARIVLDWTNPCCEQITSIRIVRNTRPTTTGGAVFTASPSSRAWVDTSFPGRRADGFSTAPIYYYLSARDAAGHYSRFYTGTSVVVGSRTISGTVSMEHRDVVVFSCCDIQGGSHRLVHKTDVSGSVGGGAFSFTLPPGRYAVCQASATVVNDPTNTCWVPDAGGGGHTVRWYNEFEEGNPGPNIDVTAASYSGIAF
jgi:hypothetical protein